MPPTRFTVTSALTVSGTVDDFDDEAVTAELRARVAAAANVDVRSVRLEVLPSSVRLVFIIDADSTSAASVVAQGLTQQLGSAAKPTQHANDWRRQRCQRRPCPIDRGGTIPPSTACAATHVAHRGGRGRRRRGPSARLTDRNSDAQRTPYAEPAATSHGRIGRGTASRLSRQSRDHHGMRRRRPRGTRADRDDGFPSGSTLCQEVQAIHVVTKEQDHEPQAHQLQPSALVSPATPTTRDSMQLVDAVCG